MDTLLHSDVEFPPIFHPDVKIEDTNYFICTESAIARLLQSAHRFRKNFKDTNVVSIGNSALKVIREEHVTRTDDHCAHRIEILGKSRLYEFSHSNIPSIGGSATVRLHTYDYNASIN